MKTKYEDLGDRPFLLVPVLDERRKDIPLDSIGRLIFGYLVYRLGNEDESKRSASKTTVSTSLRLDKKAVDKAITGLLQGGAVQQEGTRIKAIEPRGDSVSWFRRLRSANGPWHERFVYDRVFLPKSSSTLSVRTNLLFWHLVKLAFPVDRMSGYFQVGGHPTAPPTYLTSEYLANGLNCYPRTVSRGLERLKSLGLIKIQSVGSRKFVVGIPPICDSVMLWRESWNRKSSTSHPQAVVTAESLFDVPSSDILQPALATQLEAGAFIRSCGIRGGLAEEIITKITKFQVPPREWKPVLAQADRTHSENREKDPSKYPIRHCGYLFKSMLEDLIRQLEAKDRVEQWKDIRSYDQSVAHELMKNLRLPSDAIRLVCHAIREEQLPLRNGRCVPCRLHWEDVRKVAEAAGKDFAKFKRGVAEVIFLVTKGEPQSDWYDAWMAKEQVPFRDDSPMDALQFSQKEKQSIREAAANIARVHCDEQDEVAYKTFINRLIRIGCDSASAKTREAVDFSMYQISKQLLKGEVASLVAAVPIASL